MLRRFSSLGTSLSLVITMGACGSSSSGASSEVDAGVSDTADPDVASGDGRALPDGITAPRPVVQECALDVDPEGWEALNADIYADIDVDAIFRLGAKSWPVEVEYHGMSALAHPKKSFKVKCNQGMRCDADPFLDGGEPDGFGKLVLKAMYKDQSLVREALSFAVAHHMGMVAPRVGWCTLTLDGAYHGLYAVVEPVDEDFLARRGFTPGGNLYKAVHQKANFKPEHALEDAFEKKTNKSTPWTDLETLVAALQTTPTTEADYLEAIDPIFPLEAYFDRMIWVSITQNLDAVRQNFYLYAEPHPTGHIWRMLPWDADISFSNHWKLAEEKFEVHWRHMLNGGNYFGERLQSIDSLRHDYVDRFEERLATELHSEALQPLAQALFDPLTEAIAADIAHWERSSTVETEWSEIATFVAERPDLLLGFLAEFRDDPDLEDEPY